MNVSDRNVDGRLPHAFTYGFGRKIQAPFSLKLLIINKGAFMRRAVAVVVLTPPEIAPSPNHFRVRILQSSLILFCARARFRFRKMHTI